MSCFVDFCICIASSHPHIVAAFSLWCEHARTVVMSLLQAGLGMKHHVQVCCVK